MSPGCSTNRLTNHGAGRCECLACRQPFTIKQQFPDDLSQLRIAARVADMKKAVLVMYPPTDNTTGIDNAA